MRVTVDVDNELVTLACDGEPNTYRGQWVVFYASLGLRLQQRGRRPAFLQADELEPLGRWAAKKPASIGKEVARHLRELDSAGLGGILRHQRRTQSWSLAVPPRAVRLLPSREKCERWLRSQNIDYLGGMSKVPADIVDWLCATTRALLRLQEGCFDKALNCLGVAKEKADGADLLGAIAELVELRVRSRRSEYPEIPQNLERLEGRIGQALRVRAQLAQALEPGSGREFEEKMEELRRVAVRLESLPDVNGLGNVHNALSVTLRRQKDFYFAARSARYAAALLIATFDIPTLQAAVFNLGHSLHEVATTEVELKEALRLISLDREIHESLGLGGDSAQAEIVAGMICLKLRRIPEAERWLAQGERIAARLGSDYTSSGITLLRSQVLWVKSLIEPDRAPGWREEILAGYRKAEELVRAAGFPGNDIRDEARLFGLGKQPPWLPATAESSVAKR